jgi:hypothetical protein
MKSANDAQQDLILADGELRNHDSSLIFRKYVNCPACTVLELQQGTHLGQNNPEVVEPRVLSSRERAHPSTRTDERETIAPGPPPT